MTYEEIIKLWKKNQDHWEEYKFAVGAIGSFIHSYLIEHLSINRENSEHIFKMIPPNEKDEKTIRNNLFTPYDCVELKDDGWAEIGLILLLEYDENAWPKQLCRFIVSIRKTHENWNVKIGRESPVTILSFKPTLDEVKQIGEQFDKLLRIHTIESLDRWLGIKK
jgi:hypothetical protein